MGPVWMGKSEQGKEQKKFKSKRVFSFWIFFFFLTSYVTLIFSVITVLDGAKGEGTEFGFWMVGPRKFRS